MLLHQKAIYWKDAGCLIISDLHLGKSHHFRKAGVAIPKKGDYKNILILKSLIEVLRPKKVLLLGDLFHSEANNHVFEVKDALEHYKDLELHLVKGNHDVMHESWYRLLNLIVHDDKLELGPFTFTHEPMDLENIPENTYNICGHIHPGVRLVGKARQSLTLPCFYFGEQQALMPAFGAFTGLHKVKPNKSDDVFAIANKSVIPL